MEEIRSKVQILHFIVTKAGRLTVDSQEICCHIYRLFVHQQGTLLLVHQHGLEPLHKHVRWYDSLKHEDDRVNEISDVRRKF